MTLEVALSHNTGGFRLEAEFSAEQGITALFGRSGAGKSTLVNLLAGLERPDRGRIVAGGRVLFCSETGINLAPEDRRLGYVFQDARLFPHLSVGGNLLYGFRLRRPAERLHGIDEVVRLLDLGGLLGRRPPTLSGGERQRVAIGRALLAQPELLLMDEPLASLDAPRKGEILPFIERVRDDIHVPVVYVSHAMDEVIRLADTLVVLSDGKTIASGPLEDILSRLDLYPVTGRERAGAVISAAVSRLDDGDGLSVLEFAGQRMLVPSLDVPVGTRLRIAIRARDVSLSLHRPQGISILNVFAGRVAEIDDGDGGAQVNVKIDIGVPLLARITRRSLRDLGLAPGKPVHAMVKAVAINRRSAGLAPARD